MKKTDEDLKLDAQQNNSFGCITALLGIILICVYIFMVEKNIVVLLLGIGVLIGGFVFSIKGHDANEKLIQSKYKQQGIDPSKFIDAGKYINGHPKLNDPLPVMQLYVKPDVFEFYQTEIGKPYSKQGEINKSQVKNISIEDETTISKRVGVKRLLALGILAFAVRKKEINEVVYVVIEWNDGRFDHETVFEFEKTGAMSRANQFRNAMINSF